MDKTEQELIKIEKEAWQQVFDTSEQLNKLREEYDSKFERAISASGDLNRFRDNEFKEEKNGQHAA